MPTYYKTLFIGSSSFTKWKTLGEDLPEYAPLNRAFGGSTLVDLIRYEKDVIDKYSPEKLLELYENGVRIRSDQFYGLITNAAHQLVELF